jgi:SAM-dependent methyltransferase
MGCGLRKRPDTIGIDKNPRSQADIIHDLNQFPYPFDDSEFDAIICDNVLEHLDDVIRVMEEIHRIAKPGGIITVIVPFFAHRNAFNDPTHKHFFGTRSFDYFVEGLGLSEYSYSTKNFRLRSIVFDKDVKSGHWFDRWIRQFANKHVAMYENRLAHIFPLSTLTFELTVIK